MCGAYLKAGNRPKKATNVISEMARTTRAMSRTRPMIACCFGMRALVGRQGSKGGYRYAKY